MMCHPFPKPCNRLKDFFLLISILTDCLILNKRGLSLFLSLSPTYSDSKEGSKKSIIKNALIKII